MNAKEILGFLLIIIGVGLSIVILIMQMTERDPNTSFVIISGIISFATVFGGIFILNKAQP